MSSPRIRRQPIRIQLPVQNTVDDCGPESINNIKETIMIDMNATSITEEPTAPPSADMTSENDSIYPTICVLVLFLYVLSSLQ